MKCYNLPWCKSCAVGEDIGDDDSGLCGAGCGTYLCPTEMCRHKCDGCGIVVCFACMEQCYECAGNFCPGSDCIDTTTHKCAKCS